MRASIWLPLPVGRLPYVLSRVVLLVMDAEMGGGLCTLR